MKVVRSTGETSAIRALYDTAAEETGVTVSYENTILPALKAGWVLVGYDNENKPIGFLQFILGHLPDTMEYVCMERMLYVDPHHRGAMAHRLIKKLEEVATAHNCVAILAGSSLGHNETARRLYEFFGFKTNYSFRKELPDV